MNLTKDFLLANGFEFKQNEMSADYETYSKIIKNCSTFYYVEFISNLSNMIGREWTLHIQNCNFNSIASADIQTVEQANNLFKLMDIDFKLNTD